MSPVGKLMIALLWLGAAAFAAQDVVSAVQGTVSKVDAGTKTIAIKTADGSEQTLRFVRRTSVHAGEKTAAGGKDAFHGLREGSTVVAHYTAKGSEKTAEEVDDIARMA